MHSSTVTVAILTPSNRTKVQFDSADFKIEWYSGTGAGGQHRNKHQNSCRIIHLPTGEIATAQCRSRENSLVQAKSDILARLNNAHFAKDAANISENRKQQVGSGQRGDKIRTYRFQDDIVTDHYSGKKSKLSTVMSGNFDLLW